MYIYEETEPGYNEKVDRELYEESQEELEEAKRKIYDLEDDLEEAREDLKSLVDTIIEFGNKYDFSEAYPKLIEFLKGKKLI